MDDHLSSRNTLDTNKRNSQLSVFLGIENNILSSKHTFLWKYVFTSVWILSYWPVTLACAWDRLNWSGVGMLSIPWVLGSVYIYFVYGKIKKVILSGSKFIVSNYRKEIMIDILDVESVGGSIFLNPELVWLNLKENTEFGKRIILAPEHRSTFSISTGFTKHPLVAKLGSTPKKLANLKR
jgi:hypothetical protein